MKNSVERRNEMNQGSFGRKAVDFKLRRGYIKSLQAEQGRSATARDNTYDFVV
jgi:hypothetical protein